MVHNLFNNRDVELLQRAVLGESFRAGPSKSIPIRVLIIDRAGGSRQWLYSEQTKALLESTWNGDGNGNRTEVLDVRIESNQQLA